LRDVDEDGIDIRFNFRYINYVYRDASKIFEPVTYDFHDTYENLHKRGEGITEEDHTELVQQYGQSTMDIEIKEWYKILVEDIINLYYVFQLFIIIIWFMNSYYRSGVILGKLNY